MRCATKLLRASALPILVILAAQVHRSSAQTKATSSSSGLGGGVSFSCELLKHGASPADIQVTMTNGESAPTAAKFKVVVAGTLGHTWEDSSGGRQRMRPGFKYPKVFTPFSVSLDEQESPASCRITDILVCPMAPPKGAGNGYYDPFRSSSCIASADVVVPFAKAASFCTAVVDGPVSTDQFGDFKVYAVSKQGQNEQNAVDSAFEAIGARGAPIDRIPRPVYTLASSCSSFHGAVAGSAKVNSGNGSIMSNDVLWTVDAALADTQAAAQTEAMDRCHRQRLFQSEPSWDHCRILESW
jgi:hypothetical protein